MNKKLVIIACGLMLAACQSMPSNSALEQDADNSVERVDEIGGSHATKKNEQTNRSLDSEVFNDKVIEEDLIVNDSLPNKIEKKGSAAGSKNKDRDASDEEEEETLNDEIDSDPIQDDY